MVEAPASTPVEPTDAALPAEDEIHDLEASTSSATPPLTGTLPNEEATQELSVRPVSARPIESPPRAQARTALSLPPRPPRVVRARQPPAPPKPNKPGFVLRGSPEPLILTGAALFLLACLVAAIGEGVDSDGLALLGYVLGAIGLIAVVVAILVALIRREAERD
jgi:hypothetical protein